MKRLLIPAAVVALAISLSSCASGPASNIPYQKSVRGMTALDNAMFTKMVKGMGGVAFADDVNHPNSTGRELVGITRLDPSSSAAAGKERWSIRHADGRTATYLLTWSDGDFQVKPEQGAVR